MALPTIHIGSQFDAKGFKQAETATQKLTKNVKSLAGAFGIAFGARAIVQFGKDSLRAFVADDNAARSLGITLKNLGLEYGNTAANVNNFISNLERQTGVLDDQLRPAMDRLLRATGSVYKAQKLLNLALDISAGTGKDLTTVSQGLQKAYLGNNASLGRLGVGLSKAELTSSSFEEIQTRLTKLFAGQATSAADSYAGQMNKLTVAVNNAKEAIGLGLITALTEAGGTNGFGGATTDIEKFGGAIRDLIVDLGRLFKFFAAVPTIFELATDPVAAIKNYNRVYDELMALKKKDVLASNGSYVGSSGFGRNEQNKMAAKAEAKKLAADKKAAALQLAAQKKSAAAILAAQKKADAAQKNTDELKKAAAQFDLKQISIAAALKNTYDQETKLRLLAMQAIEKDQGQAALDYLKQLGILQESVQADKLKGLTTVSNAQLVALNTVLLAEIDGINKTSMSDKDKQQARLEAFAKYNDAITKQGGLAALNSYDELRQIELNKIAKIAAIDDVGSATATLQLILVSDLEALAKSQSTADAAKYQALADYITLLGVAKNEAGLAADAAYAAEVKANTLKFQAQADYMSLLTQQENEALAGVLYVESAQSKADENKHVALTDYISLLADAESAALAVAAAVASIPTVITAPSAGTGSTLPVIPGGSGGGLGGINLNPARANEGYASTNITVNTGPLLGTDETVQAAVQAAIQSLNRQGANTSYAGAI